MFVSIFPKINFWIVFIFLACSALYVRVKVLIEMLPKVKYPVFGQVTLRQTKNRSRDFGI